MISKSHFLLALALAAVTAPVALGGNGGYPQLRAGEGFSFKAPSYWSSAQPTATPAPVNAMNRSLGVPARYQVHDAPVTNGASARPKVDPLAVGYLMGMGYTPNQIHAWTVGGCSHQVKPAACFGPSRGANLTDDGATVDPLAVSYLMGYGLMPSQVRSWTVGACAQRVKAPSCYAMFKPAWWSSATTSSTKQVTDSIGFQWGDAGIGAGLTLGIVLLVGGAGAGLLISRRNGRQQAARA